MLLKTDLFNKGLNFISKIKSNKIYPGLCLFYSKNGKLYAECVSDEGIMIKALMAENVTEDVEFAIVIFKLENIMKSCTLDDFEIVVRPNNLFVKTNMESTISLYGNKNAMPRMPEYADAPVKESDLPIGERKNFLNDYLGSIHLSDKNYSYIYVKDRIVTINGGSMRSSKFGFDFHYPMFVNRTLYSLMASLCEKEDDLLRVKFFDKRYEVHKGDNQIIVGRNKELERVFENNVLSLPMTINTNTEFTLKKSEINRIHSDMTYFIREANNVILFNILDNKIIINSIDDNIEIPFNFSRKGDYTFKKINLARLYKLLTNLKDEITVKSNTPVLEFLYMENDTENVILTVVE